MRKSNSCSVLTVEEEPEHRHVPADSPLARIPTGLAFCERYTHALEGRNRGAARALLADMVKRGAAAAAAPRNSSTRFVMPGANDLTRYGLATSIKDAKRAPEPDTSGSSASDSEGSGDNDWVVPNVPCRERAARAAHCMRRVTSQKHLAPDEMYGMIEMLFRHAGLNDTSTPEEVADTLGDDGLELLLRFYATITESYQHQCEHLGLERPERLRRAIAAMQRPQQEWDEVQGEVRADDAVKAEERGAAAATAAAASDHRADSSEASSEALPPSKRHRAEAAAPATGGAGPAPASHFAYKGETEIGASRIFSLGAVVPPVHPHVKPTEPYDGPPVITMTGFGELGRWGNQILQYAFLRILADKAHAHIQVPRWVGAALFDLHDQPVQRALPAVVEYAGARANSTFTEQFMEYIRDSNGGREVPEVREEDLAPESPAKLLNCDVWGWFQWHTRHYRPHRELLRSTFAVNARLAQQLDAAIWRCLRKEGRRGPVTLVGCHLRLGDYKNIAASTFGYCAPTSWYLEWLAHIWPQLENPVLFVASDDVDAVLRDFREYHPVTTDMLGIEMPAEWKHLGAGFFPDWYTLTQCDVLAISNSTFSFTACMFNQRDGSLTGELPRYYRAHYADRMVPFDPWDAEPILHRRGGTWDALQVLYQTQGSRAVVRNLLYEMPYYGLRDVIMKTVLKARALRSRVSTAA